MIRGYLGQATVPVKPQAPAKPSKPNKPVSNKLKVDGSWDVTPQEQVKGYMERRKTGLYHGNRKANKKYLSEFITGSWMFDVDSKNYKNGSLRFSRAIQKDLKAQGYYKGTIDGYCGKKTVIAIQKFLRDKGFYKGEIDGSMGPMTVRAWQQYINSRL